MFEKVRAVEARRPFGPIWRFRAVLENTPRRPICIAGCDHEKWVVQFLGARLEFGRLLPLGLRRFQRRARRKDTRKHKLDQPTNFWKGLRGPRGRPDPQNGRFPTLEKFKTPSRKYTYLRIVTHCEFLIVGPDQKMITKRP